MKPINLQCPNCGASLTVEDGVEKTVCTYCGAEVAVPASKAKVTVKTHKLSRRALAVFGVVAAVLIIAAVAIVLSVVSKNKAPSNVYKTAGVYLVGEDIPAGEYILYPHVSKGDGDANPVFEVRLTRGDAVNASDFLYRKEFYFRQYVTLNDGEYIAFEYAYLYLPESVMLKAPDKNGYAAAQLKVGVDIPAGEYVICGKDKRVQYCITDVPETPITDLNSSHMLSFDGCENRVYVRVKDGEYLTFWNGRLFRPDLSPEIEKASDGSFLPGQYKVGKDIAAGDYIITRSENHESESAVCINKNTVNTSYIRSWETDILDAGGETLLFLRANDIESDPRVEVPDAGGEDIYVTLSYCTARSL